MHLKNSKIIVIKIGSSLLVDKNRKIRNKMNICIFGSGAIGSYIGALLHKNKINVSLICRGNHLEAINNNGLLMQSAETNEEYFYYFYINVF